MKWFRHFSDAHTNEGLRKVRAKFGNEGIGIWWTILEIIAAKMDKSDRCHAEYSVSDWCSFLGVKQKKLRLFLELTQLELGTNSVYSNNQLKIECSNLLKFKDEWSRKSGVTTESATSQKRDTEVEVDTEVYGEQSIYSSESTPPASFVKIMDSWNAMASELDYRKIDKLTSGRLKKLKLRVREPTFDIEEICKAFRTFKPRISAKADRGEWKPDFDYIIRSEDTYTKILEGCFANNRTSSSGVEHGQRAAHLTSSGSDW